MSLIGHRKILERSGEWGSGWKDNISFTLDSGCGRDLIIIQGQIDTKYELVETEDENEDN